MMVDADLARLRQRAMRVLVTGADGFVGRLAAVTGFWPRGDEVWGTAPRRGPLAGAAGGRRRRPGSAGWADRIVQRRGGPGSGRAAGTMRWSTWRRWPREPTPAGIPAEAWEVNAAGTARAARGARRGPPARRGRPPGPGGLDRRGVRPGREPAAIRDGRPGRPARPTPPARSGRRSRPSRSARRTGLRGDRGAAVPAHRARAERPRSWSPALAARLREARPAGPGAAPDPDRATWTPVRDFLDVRDVVEAYLAPAGARRAGRGLQRGQRGGAVPRRPLRAVGRPWSAIDAAPEQDARWCAPPTSAHLVGDAGQAPGRHRLAAAQSHSTRRCRISLNAEAD